MSTKHLRTALLALVCLCPTLVSAQTDPPMMLNVDYPPEIVTRGTISTPTTVDTRTASSFTTGKYFTWKVRGQVTFTITKTAGANAVVSAILFDPVTDDPLAADITYVGVDTTTSGSYRSYFGTDTLGRDGAMVAGDCSSLPADALPYIESDGTYNWPPVGNSDLAIAPNRCDTWTRILDAWYSATTITIEVNAGAALRLVSLYVVDPDGGRTETIDVGVTAPRSPSTAVDGYQVRLVDASAATVYTGTTTTTVPGGYGSDIPIEVQASWFPAIETPYTIGVRFHIYGGSTYTAWTSASDNVIKAADSTLRTEGTTEPEIEPTVSISRRKLLRRGSE